MYTMIIRVDSDVEQESGAAYPNEAIIPLRFRPEECEEAIRIDQTIYSDIRHLDESIRGKAEESFNYLREIAAICRGNTASTPILEGRGLVRYGMFQDFIKRLEVAQARQVLYLPLSRVRYVVGSLVYNIFSRESIQRLELWAHERLLNRGEYYFYSILAAKVLSWLFRQGRWYDYNRIARRLFSELRGLYQTLLRQDTEEQARYVLTGLIYQDGDSIDVPITPEMIAHAFRRSVLWSHPDKQRNNRARAGKFYCELASLRKRYTEEMRFYTDMAHCPLPMPDEGEPAYKKTKGYTTQHPRPEAVESRALVPYFATRLQRVASILSGEVARLYQPMMSEIKRAWFMGSKEPHWTRWFLKYPEQSSRYKNLVQQANQLYDEATVVYDRLIQERDVIILQQGKQLEEKEAQLEKQEAQLEKQEAQLEKQEAQLESGIKAFMELGFSRAEASAKLGISTKDKRRDCCLPRAGEAEEKPAALGASEHTGISAGPRMFDGENRRRLSQQQALRPREKVSERPDVVGNVMKLS